MTTTACNPQPISGRVEIVSRDNHGNVIRTNIKAEIMLRPFYQGVEQGRADQVSYQVMQWQ